MPKRHTGPALTPPPEERRSTKCPTEAVRAPTGAPLYLKGLDKGPQQDADGVALAEQLDQPCCSEEAEEAQVDEVVLQRRSTVFKSLELPRCADKLLPLYNLSPQVLVAQKKNVLKKIKPLL